MIFFQDSCSAKKTRNTSNLTAEKRIFISYFPMDFDIDAHYRNIESSLVIEPVTPTPIYSEKPPNHTRFVCFSDTHALEKGIQDIPPGDVLIHAGDFTNVGDSRDVRNFNAWLKLLPYQYKIVIAGNHDVSFDEQNYDPVKNRNDQGRVTVAVS